MTPLEKILTALALVCILLILALYAEGAFAKDDYFYVRLGLGKNAMISSTDKWEDQGSIGGAAGAGWRHRLKGNFHGDLSYTHNSQPLVGEPFNSKYETSSEHLYYFVEYRFQ